MRDKLALILPTALIVVAEAFFFVHNFEACLGLHLLNLFLCVTLVALGAKGSDLYIAFILISLLRVLNIGMPRYFELSLYFYPFVYIPVILACFILWYVEHYPERERILPKEVWHFLNGVGPWADTRFKPIYVLYAILIGLVLAVLEYEVLRPEALIESLDLVNLIALLVIMTGFVGFGEELVFRGTLQVRLGERLHPYVAIVIAALMFAVMHSGYSSLLYLTYVFGVGLVLGYAYHRSGNLLLVAMIHGFLNFFLFSFLPSGVWFL